MEIKCPGCGGKLTYEFDNHVSKVCILNSDGQPADIIQNETNSWAEIYCPDTDCEEHLSEEFVTNILKYLSENPSMLG